jgi:acetoin utilization deacetylase AcuC-like enzyme
MDDDSFAFMFKPIMKEVMDRYQPEAVVLQSGE